MRLMCDANVTVFSQGKEYSDTVRVEFEDQQFGEFDFGKFFADMIRKLDPDLVAAYPKERIVFDLKKIHKAAHDKDTLEKVYAK